MKLNTKKCKEVRVSFLRQQPTFTSFHIDDIPIESVESTKVLDIYFRSDLKWNNHIDEVTKKAAKRLYIIRVTRRCGLSVDDLITIYITLIRSVLEYCCRVWQSSLPAYLSDKLEQIQRRLFRSIYPSRSDKEV